MTVAGVVADSVSASVGLMRTTSVGIDGAAGSAWDRRQRDRSARRV